jgi:transcriptional/translational regulatory protein YebC/TACO1
MGRSFEVRKVSMAKTAGQKSKVYSKCGKQLYVVAKSAADDGEGVQDIYHNASLPR